MTLIPMYRIAWRSLKTGASGAGTGLFPLDKAQHYAEYMNKVNSDIGLHHWPEFVANELAPAGTTSEPHGGDQVSPPPAALPVTDEPGQGSGSVSMAAGRAGDQVTS